MRAVRADSIAGSAWPLSTPKSFGSRNGTLRLCDGLLVETILPTRPLLLRIGILEFVEVWHVNT